MIVVREWTERVRLPVVVLAVRHRGVEHLLVVPRTAWGPACRRRACPARSRISRRASSPSSTGPAYVATSATIGLPCSSSGMTGSGGARRRFPMIPTSSGASAAKSRRKRRTRGASSIGHASNPASTFGPSGWSWNSNDVTIPKLPPPPRRPQKRSGFSCSLATTNSPSAVTTSHERRLSIVRPYFRIRWPMPPPRVSPAMPVWLTIPPVTASPNTWLSRSTWSLRQPPSTRMVCASGSTRVPVIERQVDHDAVVAQGVARRRHVPRRGLP